MKKCSHCLTASEHLFKVKFKDHCPYGHTHKMTLWFCADCKSRLDKMK